MRLSLAVGVGMLLQSIQSKRGLASVVATVAIAAASISMQSRPAVSAPDPGPFAALIGSWTGTGVIKKADGGNERIRCRSSYERAAATSLRLKLRCASDSYNFDLTATVSYQGGSISGQWTETTRQVFGPIQGHSKDSGREVQATAQALGYVVNLTMTTDGNKQSIVLLTPGSEVPEVDISLDKH
jgi:hypothetical protein